MTKQQLNAEEQEISQRAKNMLQERKEHCKFPYRRIPIMFHSIDSAGRLIDVNDCWLEKLGYERDEVIGRKSVEYLTKESKRYAETVAIPEFMKTGYANDISYKFVTKSGEIVDVLLSAIAEWDEDGNYTRSLAILTDVTELKRMKESLQESEMRFRSVWENSLDGMRLIDERGILIVVNEAFCRIAEMSEKDLVGKPFTIVYSEKEKPDEFLRKYKRRFKKRDIKPYLERRLTFRSGKILDVALTNSFIEFENEQTMVLSIFRDITKSKQTGEKVRLLQSLSETVNKADNVHDALMGIIKEVCEVTYWSVGEAWVPNNDGTFLELGAWYSKDAGFKPFKKAAEESKFLHGEGLPGKAWTSKKSESLQNVSKDLYFLRRNAAQESGLKTGVSIPVLADDEVVVVLAFFFTQVGEVDKDFIDLVTAVAYQLGSLIQRKLAEDDLKISERKFRSLFEDSKDAIYINERDGRFIEINQAMLDLLGYTRKELGKIKADELYVNRDDRKRAQQQIDDEGNIKDFEVKWRRKDGSERDIILTSTGKRGEDGTVVGYQGIIRDITERKRLEKKQLKSEERYRSIVESPWILVVRLDEKARFTYLNQSWEETLGYSNDEMLGRKFTDFKRPEEAKRTLESFHFILSGGEVTNYVTTYISKTGVEKILRFVGGPIFDNSGKIIGVQSVAEDITARVQAEQQFRDLIESAPDAMVITNRGGKIRFINKQMERVFGYSMEEIIGESIEILLPEGMKSNHRKHRNGYYSKPEVRAMGEGLELSAVRKDGSEIPIEISLSPINTKEGLSVLAVIRDITKRKQAEAKIVQSRDQLRELSRRLESIREEERTEIARDIHDDLGQSLTALKLDISNIAKSTKDKDLIRKTVSMSALVDSTIKTVQRVAAKLRPGILDDLGLIPAMEWQLEEFQTRTAIECKFKYDDIDTTHDGERSTALFRIFQELLTNISRHAKASKVKVHLGVKDDIITLKVTDNGIGISDFDVEETESYGIMGIRERLYPFNGKFQIEGKKKGGTKATVILPLNIENNK